MDISIDDMDVWLLRTAIRPDVGETPAPGNGAWTHWITIAVS